MQVALTLREAVTILQPPITERALRDIIRALHIRPCGHRHGRTGRPADLFDWAEITRLHGALAPWLDATCTFPRLCA